MGCRVVVVGLAAAVFAWALLVPETLPAQQKEAGPAKQGQPQPAKKAEIKTYLHPIRKFTLAIPPGTKVTERGKTVQVSINSRQGFMINVQSGDVNPKVSLPQMAAKLEAQYMGKGKPWSSKLNQVPTTVAGLEGLETVYEGSGTRVKVIIARGRKTDFVFMFFAPRDAFEKLLPKFDWVLDSFRPNPADVPATALSGEKPMPPKAISSVFPNPKRFAEPGYGYTIQYPREWVADMPSATTATFSGKKGTDAFQAVVAIQNVQPPSAKTPKQAVDKAFTDLKNSLKKKASDVSIIGEKPLIYKNAEMNLQGHQMVVTYTFSGLRYRKWALVLPRPDGTVAHIWSYTAPDKGFETFRPLADAMLKSWTIKPGKG